MAATMVIDPRPDGWEIINADDFSNAGSNGRVASFIEKIEGISPQKTLDDAARAIGASDWVTVDDLDDDILESRKSMLLPFDIADDEYVPYLSDEDFHANTTDRKGDSLTTASSGMYTFWGNRSISAPPVNNAHEMFYGIEGDRNRSIHCQGWRIDDPGPDYGRCQVIVKTPDKMTLETAVVTRWNDAKQWFMDYCTNNQSYVDGILDSVNGVFASQRRFSKDMYTLYDEDMDVDSQSSDFYGSIKYGDPNDIGDFVLMTAYGPDGADGHMECAVKSNNEVINQFDAGSWGDAKEQFRVQSEVDGMYDDNVFQHVIYPMDLGVDYLNPYGSRNFANKKPNTQSEVRNMRNTAGHQVKADNGFVFWGEGEGLGYNNIPHTYIYFGKKGNKENSVKLDAGDFNQGPVQEQPLDCVVTGPYDNVISTFNATDWNSAKDQFDALRQQTNDFSDYLLDSDAELHMYDYDNSSYASMKKSYNQEFSTWGEDITIWGENTIENSANQFSAYINYGEDGDENNSVTMYADGDNGPNGEMSAYVVENQYGDTINSFTASSWEDAKDQFDSQCNLSGMYDKYLVTQEEEFNHLHGIGASRKRASVENSNGHVFDDSDWDAIVQNMDPDIREQLSENLAPCSNQEFFDAYADAYYNKYGEEWELDKADPQW